MVELTGFDTGPCRLFLKLESQNPGGSIKDRIALSMIAAAETRRAAEARRHHRRGDGRQHRPRPGAGRHPQGLSHRPGRARQDVAREDPAPEGAGRRGAADALRRRQGPPGVLPGHGRADRRRDRRAPSSSTSSPTRPIRCAHETTTGPEIWEQMGGDVDAVVVGVGSGGTLTGPRPLLREGVAEDRDGAGRSGRLGPGAARQDRRDDRGRKLDGRGHRRGFHSAQSPTCRCVKKAYSITDQREHRDRARAAVEGRHPRRLVVRHAARRRAALLPRADRRRSACVTFVCDSGNKYLSKVYNDFWLVDQGLAEREQHGDLRDLIARAHREGGTVTVGPDDTLLTAYARMRARRRLAAAGARGRHDWSASSTRATSWPRSRAT